MVKPSFSGWCLKMAGKVDFENREFFEQQVAPHIDGQQIEFWGEVSQTEKQSLIGQATATLFPILWPEPFGLVMAESLVGSERLSTAAELNRYTA